MGKNSSLHDCGMTCVSESGGCTVCEPLFATWLVLHKHHWISQTQTWWAYNSQQRILLPSWDWPFSFIHAVFCILYYFTGQTVTLISPPVHIGERYQKLLTVLQMVEREKTRHASAAQGLQERLTRAQEEISLLQTSITERSSHYQQLHNQLLDKATQATSLEKEVSDPSNQFPVPEQCHSSFVGYHEHFCIELSLLAACKKCELEAMKK